MIYEDVQISCEVSSVYNLHDLLVECATFVRPVPQGHIESVHKEQVIIRVKVGFIVLRTTLS